ncbi:MAG: peptide chain release factor N(5)-glutamine methyltransferase [Thermoanaerobaculia bacterium]
MTVKDLFEAANRLAKDAGADATPWDARILMAHATGGTGPLALDWKRELAPAVGKRFEELWQRRLAGVPVQHLVGEWDFYGRTFTVDGRGLAPRPETELLVEAALREAPEARRILDAGTGSGILAVTLLAQWREARAVALDSSLEALALARENTLRHGVGDRVALVGSDWLSALSALSPPGFDLAVSNPPYLAFSDRANLSPTVRDHDPSMALFAGSDGLEAIRHLLDALPAHLAPGAPFLFELGYGQAAAVEREIRKRPAWTFVRIEPDLAGIPRVAIVKRSNS